MDMRIPPIKIKIMLESNPLKSRILVRRLAERGPCNMSSASGGSLQPVCSGNDRGVVAASLQAAGWARVLKISWGFAIQESKSRLSNSAIARRAREPIAKAGPGGCRMKLM